MRWCFPSVVLLEQSGGAFDRAQGTGAAHRARPPPQGDGPGLRHLLDPERGQDGEQRLQLVRGAGGLEGHRVGVDVDDARAEQLGGLQHLRALGQRRADLHEQQLALDGGALLQLDDLDHLDQLVQLLGDLLERRGLGVGDDRHAGEVGVLGRADGERLDVEAAAAEQRRDAGQDTGLVLDQDRERVAGHLPTFLSKRIVARGGPPFRGPSRACERWGERGSFRYIWSSPKTGRTSRAAMISSLLAPAATIGHTWASWPTTKSMTTGASVIAIAFSITASTSSLDSQRSPMQPIASASSTKSGMRTGLGVPSSLRACSRVLE